MLSNGTIIALSTPQGQGAIGLIRISGPEAISKTKLFFQAKSKIPVDEAPVKEMIFGDFIVKDEIIDEVLITKFKGPKSYTGEDIIEISCHGSSFVLQTIIGVYIDNGLLPAKPGEFTLRAYLNRKIDLSQAEAVFDIISSETKNSHRLAMQQLRGGFSKKMESLREELIQFKALIELELDFSEEEVSFANLDELKSLLDKLHKDISVLINSFAYGNAIKNGIPVTIAGKPNVGKSSLLNLLLNDDRAIVSDIPGTTRDSIEDTIVLEGILFRFIDTAGIRKTSDLIEEIGVKRAKEKVKKSKILVYLYEDSNDPSTVASQINELLVDDINLIIVENKIDLNDYKYNNSLASNIKLELTGKNKTENLGISTKTPEAIYPLQKLLVKIVKNMNSESNIIINNVRHLHALKEALISIKKVKKSLKKNLSGDLLSIDLKEAINHIGSITGNIDHDEDILGTIFSQFCIGK